MIRLSRGPFLILLYRDGRLAAARPAAARHCPGRAILAGWPAQASPTRSARGRLSRNRGLLLC